MSSQPKVDPPQGGTWREIDELTARAIRVAEGEVYFSVGSQAPSKIINLFRLYETTRRDLRYWVIVDG